MQNWPSEDTDHHAVGEHLPDVVPPGAVLGGSRRPGGLSMFTRPLPGDVGALGVVDGGVHQRGADDLEPQIAETTMPRPPMS